MEIEAVLNDRPLTYLCADVTDPEPPTPSHLLYGRHTYVTGPAKIGHICTQNLTIVLNFNLQYLLKDECYDNEIFMSYSQINKTVNKSDRT